LLLLVALLLQQPGVPRWAPHNLYGNSGTDISGCLGVNSSVSLNWPCRQWSSALGHCVHTSCKPWAYLPGTLLPKYTPI